MASITSLLDHRLYGLSSEKYNGDLSFTFHVGDPHRGDSFCCKMISTAAAPAYKIAVVKVLDTHVIALHLTYNISLGGGYLFSLHIWCHHQSACPRLIKMNRGQSEQPVTPSDLRRRLLSETFQCPPLLLGTSCPESRYWCRRPS